MQVTCALQKVHHQRRVIEMLMCGATPDEKAHSALEIGRSLIISLARMHQPPNASARAEIVLRCKKTGRAIYCQLTLSADFLMIINDLVLIAL